MRIACVSLLKKIHMGFNNPEQRHSEQWKQRFTKLRMRKWVPGHGRPGKPEVNTMFTRRRPFSPEARD
ncbi:hypothetical protein P6N53_12215 [Desulforamulus aquiferis]|uniref:HTH CENPB-type domain-containing protein n=1 Tax=Desulforamulus aquiferis TaxID=1397668 RepID=A0AAW7ZFE1_9FIRM|nr:hypothetical protein [Desulforamulus aquiferis]